MLDGRGSGVRRCNCLCVTEGGEAWLVAYYELSWNELEESGDGAFPSHRSCLCAEHHCNFPSRSVQPATLTPLFCSALLHLRPQYHQRDPTLQWSNAVLHSTPWLLFIATEKPFEVILNALMVVKLKLQGQLRRRVYVDDSNLCSFLTHSLWSWLMFTFFFFKDNHFTSSWEKGRNSSWTILYIISTVHTVNLQNNDAPTHTEQRHSLAVKIWLSLWCCFLTLL